MICYIPTGIRGVGVVRVGVGVNVFEEDRGI